MEKKKSWLNWALERLKLKDFQSKLNNALSTEQLKLPSKPPLTVVVKE